MPYRLPTPCAAPACPALTHGRYCEKHQHLARDTRPSAPRRGYDRAWRKLRDAYLAAHPNCEDPEGRHEDAVPGETVDHIIPLPEGARLDPRNLQTLCRSCHARKTRRENPQST